MNKWTPNKLGWCKIFIFIIIVSIVKLSGFSSSSFENNFLALIPHTECTFVSSAWSKLRERERERERERNKLISRKHLKVFDKDRTTDRQTQQRETNVETDKSKYCHNNSADCSKPLSSQRSYWTTTIPIDKSKESHNGGNIRERGYKTGPPKELFLENLLIKMQ